LFVPRLEKLIGIEVYVTRSAGAGGVIRQFVDDFVVEEVLVDGSKAEVHPPEGYVKRRVLNSSAVKEHRLLCFLVKRNWDTILALRAVAKQLGISTRRIHIAGMKDAKAVTAQHITVEGVSREDIEKVHVKDIKIRPIGYFHHKLSPYYLLKNSFCIIIRAISHPKSTAQKRITKNIEELKAIGGIPNFFGHQRFGTTRPITHLVGKAIVKGDFEKAAMLFLAKPSSHEHTESRQIREELQATLDFKQASKSFPIKLYYERLMLKHLAKKPEDFIGAFRRLPIRLRQLFPQAYQSYLFNKALSRRIENGSSLNRVEVGDYAVSVERSGLPMPTMYKTTNTQTLNEINTAIKNGRMRLAIPLVGFKQHLSDGVQGETEKQILEEEDISPENFKIHAMPEITLRGELRSALAPLNNFLIEEISDDSANPSKCRAKVGFTLYRGSYATVFLREIMKPRNLIDAGF